MSAQATRHQTQVVSSKLEREKVSAGQWDLKTNSYYLGSWHFYMILKWLLQEIKLNKQQVQVPKTV